MSNILDKIVETKRKEVERLEQESITPDSMASLSASLPPRRDFVGALKNPTIGDIGIISEIKKASPSKGVIQPQFDHKKIASLYAKGGAGCLSVLTDEPWFQGHLKYLNEIRVTVKQPLLRKDFMIDPRQFPEALRAGADAILLIAAILSDQQLKDFRILAEASGMAALVEVHDQIELDRALRSGATFLGVNNRNLKTFEVDLQTTSSLAQTILPQLKSGEVFLVAESGINSRRDVETLKSAGAGALLVGESLMRAENPADKIKELVLPDC